MRKDMVSLFCFPFAGGSFYSYRGLELYLGDCIKLIGIDLPGHGRRIKEPLLKDANKMAEDILAQIIPYLNEPYAIYGHSLGAILGYIVMQMIKKQGMRLPLHVFVSGCPGPSVKRNSKGMYLLPKNEFFQSLVQYGGTPKEILAQSDLMEMMEPILRADFEAAETYRYKNDDPMDVPITVMTGSTDSVTADDAMKWQEISARKIQLKKFSGGHFFIFDHMAEIGSIIQRL